MAARFAVDRGGELFVCDFEPSDVLAVITWDSNGHRFAADAQNAPAVWSEWVMRPNGRARTQGGITVDPQHNLNHLQASEGLSK
jgi:hypothetical protein